MKHLKAQILINVVLIFFSTKAYATGLKVFGREFCNPYDAGACINFHYKNLKDAKNWLGEYKYPKGKAAYDECFRDSDKTDAGVVLCAMLFHKVEQTAEERAAMCTKSVREEYWRTISGGYAMSLYDAVWGCTGRQ